MLTLNAHPTNKDYFLKLITFGKKCLDICHSFKIEPIIHGSVAYLFYTADESIEINDLDLLVPESSIKILAEEFKKMGIEYILTEHPSLNVFENDAKISFHSKEYFLKNQSEQSAPVSIDGTIFQILNLKSLIKGYETSRDSRSDKVYVYVKKIDRLAVL